MKTNEGRNPKPARNVLPLAFLITSTSIFAAAAYRCGDKRYLLTLPAKGVVKHNNSVKARLEVCRRVRILYVLFGCCSAAGYRRRDDQRRHDDTGRRQRHADLSRHRSPTAEDPVAPRGLGTHRGKRRRRCRQVYYRINCTISFAN